MCFFWSGRGLRDEAFDNTASRSPQMSGEATCCLSSAQRARDGKHHSCTPCSRVELNSKDTLCVTD